MVSAEIINANPTTMSETERKSLKKRIISSLSFFKDKKKDRCKNEKEKEKHEESKQKEEKTNPVDKILENLQKLEIEKKKTEADDDVDESDLFCFKSIEEDGRSERIDSHSSEDSGFVDTKDVIENLKNLKIDKEEKKNGEKKKQTVVLARKPPREKMYRVTNKPYDAEDVYRQIRQINRKTLTGGQVLVNSTQPDNFSEVDRALNSVKEIAQTSQQEQGYWDDVQDMINGDFKQKDTDFLSEFFPVDQQGFEPIAIVPTSVPECNPIEEFSCANHLNYEESVDVSTILNLDHMKDLSPSSNIFPTPPRSENVPSPISESQASYYPSHSDYTLSPELSPVYYSDYEKYQDLTSYGSPNSVDDKPRDRSASICSMKMKQFKDLQKEIAAAFSKMECCEVMRKSCKEILQEHISKLDAGLRRKICVEVSQMDLKTCYGVMHHIMLSLAKSGEDEDLQYSLFGLICERVLAQKPALFAHDFGLSILKSAALRCPGRPFLTRCVVQAIRTALKSEPELYSGKECIFVETDLQGDTLVSACARAGDTYALVLSEITRNDCHGQPALFNVNHLNTDGQSALHLSCSLHSKQSPHIHMAHVLLEHSGADLQQGDGKGGDTPIHLAVNSANCDLHLVLLLFKTVDRKAWKNLAYLRNKSFVSPFDYARSAAKSTTRQNYPPEILDFFKKCR